MTTALNRSLARKREMLENNDKGFTLIELLVVVLIIGVLAAIAIPIYIGVQDSAKNNAVQAAVTQAKTAVVAQYTSVGTFPANMAAVNGYAGSSDIDVTLTGTAIETFCISGAWTDGTHEWAIDQSQTAVEGGTCNAGALVTP